MHQLSYWKVEQPPPKVEYRPRVRDLPTREQPVNRVRHVGPEAVSTTELLACLLQTPDALDQAQQLLARFDGLPGLVRACETEITQVTGIGPAQAARIKAALEFGRRLLLVTPEDRFQIRSPADAAQLLLAELSHLDQEHFVVLCLDTRNRLVHSETVYKGSVNAAQIRVAEILRPAITRQCPCIVTSHNHPSGDCSPSPDDSVVVGNITEACKLMDVDHLDHIVVGRGRFVSMRERGLGFS
jgi:DNA repair protein RadC